MQSVHGEQPVLVLERQYQSKTEDECAGRFFSMKEGGAKGFFLHTAPGDGALPYCPIIFWTWSAAR